MSSRHPTGRRSPASPRRRRPRDQFAAWEYAIMAVVVLIALAGVLWLLRVVTSDEPETSGPVPASSAPQACSPSEWTDPATGQCAPRAECAASQAYDEQTNTCAAPAPRIAEVLPSTGRASGGTVLTITGFDFQQGATVLIGDAPGVETSVIDSSTIVTRTPPGTSFAPVDVEVANPDGQTDGLDNVFTYEAPEEKRITEVVPDTGSTAGGEAVVIRGRDFVDGAVVSFNGRAAIEVEVLNPSTLRVVIPPSEEGSASINVRNPGEAADTLTDAFTYVDRAPRVVTSVRPARGPAAGGTDITIRGSGFEPGAVVLVGGEEAGKVEVVSSSRITAIAPPGGLGPADVAVRNPDVPAAILRDAYIYVEAPTITAVSPRRGPLEGGSRVTITGTGFTRDAVVTIGPDVVEARIIDEETIRFVTPRATGAGPVPVTVANPGQPPATLKRAFVYVAPEPVASPEPTPSATRPARLPRCPSVQAPSASTTVGSALLYQADDLVPAAGLEDPVLVDAGIEQGGGSLTWASSPARLQWESPSSGPASATIRYVYESRSCRGLGTGTAIVQSQ